VNRSAIRSLYFAGAAIAGAAAVAPPLDRLAGDSFAWHMLQHLVLLFVVPLLLMLARPFQLFARLAGKRRAAPLIRATQPLHALGNPAFALSFFIATLWVTHFSPLYELSLEHEWIHAGEHLLYLVAGTIFWVPVLAPPPLRPLSYPERMLYLAVALPQGALLGMAILSAREPLYAHYAGAAGSAAAALGDQSNAAAVMWILGGLTILSALLLTLAAWARREMENEPTLGRSAPCGNLKHS
jgi:putative membrane protein